MPTPDLRLLALAWGCGVTAVLVLPTLPGLGLSLLLAAPALWPWRGRALWSAIALGMLFASWQAQRALDQRLPPDRHGETLWVEGMVASIPERTGVVGGGAIWRFRFDTRQADIPRRLRVSWYRSDVDLAAGQCWRLLLRLRTPRGSLNPGGFDYESWLLRNGVGATASVRSGERCADADGHRMLRMRQAIADRIDSTLRRGEPDASPSRALLAALTVGDRSGLSDADWDRLRVTGTTHLFAISGLHLGIIAGCVFFVLRWGWSLWPALCLRVPAQRVGLYGSGVAALAYAALAGFELPVMRALIMLLVLIVAAAFHRLRQPARALIYAWALILLIDPFAPFAPGLWLSFGAVAAILFMSLGRRKLPTAWRVAVRVQLFLSLALVPLTLQFFGGLAWLSPLVNLIAIPVFSLLTPLALLAVLACGVHDGLGQWCLQTAAWLLDIAWAALGAAAELAPAAWIPASPPAAALVLGGIGVVLLFAPRGLPLRPLALIGLLALLLPRAQTIHELEVAALDVGQGTAVVVRTPRHTLLFDAGPAFDEGFDAGRSVVVPYLLSQGVRRIDALVVSHDDNDHAGGVGAVRQMLVVDRVIGTPYGEPCVDGLSWDWDGIRFRFLHPDDGRWSSNNGSCVLHIDGPFDVLLPGDVERGAEARLLRAHRDMLSADVLLSPHHGSGTSSTAGLIAAVSPQIVIHTAAWRSRYGHPRRDVVARYDDARARQHVTGVEGALRVYRDASGGLEVESWRRRAARWWNAPAAP